MRASAIAFAIACALASPACNREALGSGDSCTRSSECEDGLVCVEGACSANLAGIGDPGSVPMLMEEEMPAEGESDAATMMGGEPGTMSDAAPADAAASDSGS
ncbi:MAG TPA: hypothetical protein VK509_23665 [Polyangiales bacterium]|nr:hypothetical protein [Polyangiales bacterium]